MGGGWVGVQMRTGGGVVRACVCVCVRVCADVHPCPCRSIVEDEVVAAVFAAHRCRTHIEGAKSGAIRHAD